MIFASQKYETKGVWRRCHYAELMTMYSNENIVSNLKTNRKRWTGPRKMWKDAVVADLSMMWNPVVRNGSTTWIATVDTQSYRARNEEEEYW